MPSKNISKDELGDKIRHWAMKKYGGRFKFRSSQLEMIRDVIYSWFNGVEDAVLTAPTGSGKSIISLTIAGFLSDVYKMSGFILISDLSLLKQYENDVNLNFPEWGIIKGQANYRCVTNGLPYPTGACKLDGCRTYTEMKAYDDCYNYCTYIVDKMKAQNARVTVCTYSYWLMHQNMTTYHVEGVERPFTGRDFTICDEAHKLVDIVQSHFSPVINKTSDEERIKRILSIIGPSFEGDLYSDYITTRDLLFTTDDKKLTAEYLKNYTDSLLHILAKSETSVKPKLKTADKKTSVRVLHDLLWLEDNSCRFNDYCEVVSKNGSDCIVKNIKQGDHVHITYNCIDESYLMAKKFHSHCKNKLFMSATLGDQNAYAKSISVEKYAGYEMPNTFDYTNSPIYYTSEYRMSYDQKNTSIGYIILMINNILTMYPNYRGIIQTGNYEVAKVIYDNLLPAHKPRASVYSDAAGKEDAIEHHRYNESSVLIGPTLIEGLSLDDDLCRFQIIAKVPYPSLADVFVSEKMKLDEGWYANRTAMAILQGVGRGIRNDKDWCVTFILDGCFTRLIRSSENMFNGNFKDRLVCIPATSLLNIGK